MLPIELVPVRAVLVASMTQAVGLVVIILMSALNGTLGPYLAFLPVVWALQLLRAISRNDLAFFVWGFAAAMLARATGDRARDVGDAVRARAVKGHASATEQVAGSLWDAGALLSRVSGRRPGRWLMTGSQSFSLMRGVSQTLAGRIAVLTLEPVSTEEIGDVAAWLAASLSGRDGPSAVGARIAMEVVREAESSAESLGALNPAALGVIEREIGERRVGKECRSRWSPYH